MIPALYSRGQAKTTKVWPLGLPPKSIGIERSRQKVSNGTQIKSFLHEPIARKWPISELRDQKFGRTPYLTQKSRKNMQSTALNEHFMILINV